MTWVKKVITLSPLRVLPHQCLLRRLPCRADVEVDVKMWVRFDKQSRSAMGHFKHVIVHNREFRNVFYYRAEQDRRLFSRVLLTLCQVCFPPLESLVMNVGSIGPGLFIQHGFATVIFADRIGCNCWINQCVTIGHLNEGARPVLGDNVMVTTGAKVLGDITIGDNVKIGANAVVLRNVPPNCTVVGVPAYIVKRDGRRVREPLEGSDVSEPRNL